MLQNQIENVSFTSPQWKTKKEISMITMHCVRIVHLWLMQITHFQKPTLGGYSMQGFCIKFYKNNEFQGLFRKEKDKIFY